MLPLYARWVSRYMSTSIPLKILAAAQFPDIEIAFMESVTRSAGPRLINYVPVDPPPTSADPSLAL